MRDGKIRAMIRKDGVEAKSRKAGGVVEGEVGEVVEGGVEGGSAVDRYMQLVVNAYQRQACNLCDLYDFGI